MAPTREQIAAKALCAWRCRDNGRGNPLPTRFFAGKRLAAAATHPGGGLHDYSCTITAPTAEVPAPPQPLNARPHRLGESCHADSFSIWTMLSMAGPALALPSGEQIRGLIAAKLSEALAQPVEIGSIEVVSATTFRLGELKLASATVAQAELTLDRHRLEPAPAGGPGSGHT